jgi:DNA-binding transcriptional MocR family regulator
MSIEAMAWAKRQRCGDASAKLVLLILADYANHKGQAWPSHATIAEQAELNRATVIRKLAALESKGLIAKEARADEETGAQSSNRYTLTGVADCDGVVAPRDPPPSHSATQTVTLNKNTPPALAEDWQPSDAQKQDLATRHPELDLDHELGQFVGHARGKGLGYHDPAAVFAAWCSRSAKWSRERGARSSARPARRGYSPEDNRRRASATLARLAALSDPDPGGD